MIGKLIPIFDISDALLTLSRNSLGRNDNDIDNRNSRICKIRELGNILRALRARGNFPVSHSPRTCEIRKHQPLVEDRSPRPVMGTQWKERSALFP